MQTQFPLWMSHRMLLTEMDALGFTRKECGYGSTVGTASMGACVLTLAALTVGI